MCTGNETSLEEIRLCILSSPHYYFPIEVFYGLLSIVCFLGGTCGNVIAFFYFFHQRRDNSTIIYMPITLVDVVISITQLPVGFSYLDQRKPGIFGNVAFCNVWHFVWQIMSRQSVALVAILSITRTLSILFPLKIRISKKSIVVSLVATAVLQTFTGSIMYWFGGSGVYTPGNADCSLLIIDDIYYYYHVVPTMVWYWIPVLPVIASCFISLRVLKRSKKPLCKWQKVEKRQSQGQLSINKSKDNATMTIVLLTALYVVFNMPMCVFNIFWTIDDMKEDPDSSYFLFDMPTYYVNNMVYCLCVPLNSLANPILYLCRIKRLRTALIGKTMRLFGSSSNNATKGGIPLQTLVGQPQNSPLMRGESINRPSVYRKSSRNVTMMSRSPSSVSGLGSARRHNAHVVSQQSSLSCSVVRRQTSLGCNMMVTSSTVQHNGAGVRITEKRLSVPRK